MYLRCKETGERGAREKASVIVLSIIGDCGSKSGRDKVDFYSVPAIITNQGEEFEELNQVLWRAHVNI